MEYNVPGDLLVLAALAFNVAAGLAFFRVARGNDSCHRWALRSYNLFTLTVTLAAVYLWYLFFSHNYAVRYVYEYSERSLPFSYLLSAFWGGQEGTYLLWLLLNAWCGYLVIRWGGRYRDYGMAVFSLVNTFFLLILVKLSPFALLDFPATDGAGLNPLLQDPWMVVHPPVIFIGYALTAVPFAITLAALIRGQYSDWVKRVFPWVVAAALMLGAGNIMGGYWAYKTLGWGGYWAWDPVENSSFIPWFASLALVHGLIIQKRSGALRKSNILLTAFLFILVIYGTFLTRSGVLADFSVHSFVDLGTNICLIAFLLFFVLLTIALFVPRIGDLKATALSYNYYGREFTLFAATALLFVFSVIVLFWSSLPLVTSLLTSQPRAADPATYNDFALPMAVLYSLVLAVFPQAGRETYRPPHWVRRLVFVAVAAAVVGLGLFYLVLSTTLTFALLFGLVATGLTMYLMRPKLVGRLIPALAALAGTIPLALAMGVRDPMYVMFFAVAAMATVSNLTAMAGLLPGRWRLAGSHLAHFGFGLMLIGVLASSAFSTSERVVLSRQDGSRAFGLDLKYHGMAHDITYPRNELVLTADNGENRREFRPQLYYSERLDGIMRRPSIDRRLFHDLYFSPQQVEQPEHGGGLRLAKGDTEQLGEFSVTFQDFVTNRHGDSTGYLNVAAVLEVFWDGAVDTIRPAVELIVGAGGRSEFVDHPAFLDEAKQHEVRIEKIEADDGAVILAIGGLAEIDATGILILDISRKPLMNLVWAGTTLILVGCLVAYFRRRHELTS